MLRLNPSQRSSRSRPIALDLILAAAAVAAAAVLHARKERRKKIFVSYDYDRDRRYRHLLSAWDANRNFSFTFDDHSTPLIHSADAARIKAAITRKLQESNYLLV